MLANTYFSRWEFMFISLAIILSCGFKPAMAETGNVLLRFCFSPMVVTQVIEQINHYMRKGSKSTKCQIKRQRYLGLLAPRHTCSP